MADKVLALLGLCRKAGKLLGGYDVCVQAARQGEAKLLLAARDISDKTYKNMLFEAGRAGIPCARAEIPMEELGRACRLRAGVLAVTDEGFARALLDAHAKEAVKREGGICL